MKTDDRAELHTSRAHTVLNWALALGTLLGAAAVVVFAYLQVLGTAACSAQTCPSLGPGEIGFTVIIWGAPVISILAVVVNAFTARRRWGLLVPLAAWTFLVIAAVVLTVTFP